MPNISEIIEKEIESLKESVDDTTRMAVLAALDAIDTATNGKTRKSSGPLGDKLAAELDKVVRQAMNDWIMEKGQVVGQ